MQFKLKILILLLIEKKKKDTKKFLQLINTFLLLKISNRKKYNFSIIQFIKFKNKLD